MILPMQETDCLQEERWNKQCVAGVHTVIKVFCFKNQDSEYEWFKSTGQKRLKVLRLYPYTIKGSLKERTLKRRHEFDAYQRSNLFY